MTYDELLMEADRRELIVREKPLRSANGRIYGKRIAIRMGMSQAEKVCTLAEEMGHYETSVGNILDQSDTNNRKQEKVARKWAVDKLIKVEDLFRAEEYGCETLYDIAEYLNVTEEFLNEALQVFKQRYGIRYEYNEKTLVFNDYGFHVIK